MLRKSIIWSVNIGFKQDKRENAGFLQYFDTQRGTKEENMGLLQHLVEIDDVQDRVDDLGLGVERQGAKDKQSKINGVRVHVKYLEIKD